MLQPGGKLEASATYKYVAKTFWSCLPRYTQTFLFTEKEKCYTYVRWRHANIEHYLIKNQLLGFYLIFLLILKGPNFLKLNLLLGRCVLILRRIK